MTLIGHSPLGFFILSLGDVWPMEDLEGYLRAEWEWLYSPGFISSRPWFGTGCRLCPKAAYFKLHISLLLAAVITSKVLFKITLPTSFTLPLPSLQSSLDYIFSNHSIGTHHSFSGETQIKGLQLPQPLRDCMALTGDPHLSPSVSVSSKAPVTLAPGAWRPLLAPMDTYTHVHLPTQVHIITNKAESFF